MVHVCNLINAPIHKPHYSHTQTPTVGYSQQQPGYPQSQQPPSGYQQQPPPAQQQNPAAQQTYPGQQQQYSQQQQQQQQQQQYPCNIYSPAGVSSSKDHIMSCHFST